MTEVRTDHQIVPFGENLMQLFDANGKVLVTAKREHDRVPWEIHVDDDGVPDATADTRSDAIYQMTEHAVAADSIEGTGFSTLVPHGLPERP